MKNKLDVKWTDEELKEIEYAAINYRGGCRSLEDWINLCIMDMMNDVGRPDFGKLPKHITRHGGNYQIQFTDNKSKKTHLFGTYPTLKEAKSMLGWLLKKEDLFSYSNKGLMKYSQNGKKWDKGEYVGYLNKLREEEEQSLLSDVNVKPNPASTSKKKKKKVLKSLSLPQSQAKLLEDMRNEYNLKQSEIVQAALNFMKSTDDEKVEKYLYQEGYY